MIDSNYDTYWTMIIVYFDTKLKNLYFSTVDSTLTNTCDSNYYHNGDLNSEVYSTTSSWLYIISVTDLGLSRGKSLDYNYRCQSPRASNLSQSN